MTITGKILVLDTDRDRGNALEEMLVAQGCQVYRMPLDASVQAAVQAAAEAFAPDLMLLELQIPAVRHGAIADNLKTSDRLRDVPILYLGAIADREVAFAIGGADCITLPLSAAEVNARVTSHLQLRRWETERMQLQKMAVLGQLVAGIAHELNTPLGAIRSSVENIAVFFRRNLQQLPAILRPLSDERFSDFLMLLERSLSQAEQQPSSRERRQFKRQLTAFLENHPVAGAEAIADNLVDMGIYDEIESFLPLLCDIHGDVPGREILQTAYQIVTVQRSSQTIATATERAARIVLSLRTYARYDAAAAKSYTDLREGLETILTIYHNQIKHGVEVIRRYEEMPPALCYTDELHQLWSNLIHNALQAMDFRGTLEIAVTRQGQHAAIAITDSGKGIPPELLPRIFEPFFTTKPAGEGSGLGLDIARTIVEKHSGRITVESIPGRTTFTVLLPVFFSSDSSTENFPITKCD